MRKRVLFNDNRINRKSTQLLVLFPLLVRRYMAEIQFIIYNIYTPPSPQKGKKAHQILMMFFFHYSGERN